jgi:Zn-dependent metalloprotease
MSLTVLAVVALVCTHPATFRAGAQESETDPQVTSMRVLESASERPARIRFADGFPRSVSARVRVGGENAVERASNFLREYRDLYAQSVPHLELKVRRVSRPEARSTGDPPAEDTEGVVFYQTYRGIEVFGGELLVSLSGERVFHTLGALLTSDVNLDPVPSLSAAQAEQAAARALGRRTLRTAAPSRLMVFDRGLLDSATPSQPRLAWRVSVEVGGEVLVDAKTGETLLKLPAAMDTGSALHGFDLDMQDAEDEAQAQDGPPYCYWSSDDVDVADESSFNSDYVTDFEAVFAYGYIKDVYGFYHESFDRHSYDNQSSQVELFIHSTTSGNASWVPDCELIQVATGEVSFETLTHEFTHGVIGKTSKLIYANESGALNESYADVMAVIADQERSEANGQVVDWTYAEDKTDGNGPRRDFEDPTDPALPGAPQVAHYSNYVPLATDFGGVHTYSGIPNKATHLMIAGGTFSGVTVAPMDRDKVKELKYSALRNLPPASTMLMAREYEIEHAKEWVAISKHDFTNFDVCTVTNAWAAVGVGPKDEDCDGQLDAGSDGDGDGIWDGDNCPDVANPTQVNSDLDPDGDVCDPDDDNDGVPDVDDNCDNIYNPEQYPCNDADGDKVLDVVDNCDHYNPSQKDTNGDGEGDACEDDIDDDGVNDEDDNCPGLVNPDQADAEGDGYGDACDLCPQTPDKPIVFMWPGGVPMQPDGDGDGIADTCDPAYVVDGIVGAGGGLWLSEQTYNVQVASDANIIRRVPLNLCWGLCPDWFEPEYHVELTLEDLGRDVRAWVSDDEGRSVQKADGADELRTLSFSPQGGRRYYLNLMFRQPPSREGSGGEPRTEDFRVLLTARTR